MEKTQKFLALSTVILILCSAILVYANVANSTPTCELITVVAPASSVTGEGIEVDLRYTNNGPTGPTFLRMRDRMGNIYNFIDIPTHETGDQTKGIHIYWSMPNDHLIYQIEIGTGTSYEPIKIINSTILVILNENIPAPEPGPAVINLNIVYPVIALNPTIDVNICPGQSINISILIVSIIDTAPTQLIKYHAQTNADPNIVTISWLHNDEPWIPSKSYEISGGETNTLILMVKLPIDVSETDYTFRVTPEIVG